MCPWRTAAADILPEEEAHDQANDEADKVSYGAPCEVTVHAVAERDRVQDEPEDATGDRDEDAQGADDAPGQTLRFSAHAYETAA